MDAQDHLSGSDAEPSSRHALNRPVAVPDPEPDRDSDAWFAVVLRGYDRAQVDARLAELEHRVSDEARRADVAESALGAVRSQAREPQAAPAAAAGTTDTGTDDRSFGSRLERVLQAAEREAADLREKAAAEAASVLETARAEAEQRREQTEQALLGRAATLDQEFTARAAALDARERDVDERVAAGEREAAQAREEATRSREEAARVREEAGRAREEATRAAAAERAAAEERAAELMHHAEETVREQRAEATREVRRIGGLRDEVREELSRLRGMLGVELDRKPVAVAPDDEVTSGPARDTATAPPTGTGSGTATDRTGTGTGTDRTGTGTGTATERSGTGVGHDADGDPLTGKLRVTPARDTDEHANERTEIGAIPPFTVSSIGVLPFRDRSAGAIGDARPFTGPGDEPARRPSDREGATPATGVAGTGSGAWTSDDGGSSGGSATRSASSTRGPR